MILSGKDYKGREWNRAHHDGTWWIAASQLATKQGFSWPEAALFTGDSMTSWAGRVIGSNNQDGDKTGFAADELAGLKYLVIAEQATGKDILTSVLKSHADTHLPQDKLTDPKIFKLLGIDHKKGAPPTDAEIQAIRNFALQSTTQVNQGEFQKFLDKTPPELAQQINATGLLNTVQFKPENHNHDNGGGGNNNTNNEPTDAEVTGAGTGPAADLTGGGGTAPVFTPGTDPNAGTGAAATSYDGTGDFGGATATGAKLAAGQLPVSATTIGADPLNALTNPVSTALGGANLLDADKGKILLDLLEKEQDLNKAWTSSPRQQALEAALKDGKVSAGEQKSLLGRLGDKGKSLLSDLLSKSKDGSISADDLAKVEAAIASDDTDAISKALDDLKLTRQEKADLKDKLSDARDKAIKAAEADGVITDAELQAILKAGTEAPKPMSADDKKALEAALKDGKLTDAEKKSLEGKLSDAQQAVLDDFVGKDGKVSADAKAIEGAVAKDAKATPGKTDATPGKDGAAPGKDAVAGKDATPGKDGTSPGKADATPGKDGSAPKSTKATGDHSSTATGGAKKEPAKADAPKADAPKADAKKDDKAPAK
jgi:hypothetical protein